MIKLSADQMKKMAEIEAYDREQAVEVGFAKAAQDLGLSKAQYETFYQKGLEKLQKAAQR